MKQLIDLKILNGVNDAPRGFMKINKEKFLQILKETKTDGSFVVD